MSRGWLWLQLAVAWLPMWALFAAIIVIVHGAPIPAAAIGSLRMIVPGAILGIGVSRLASRIPWPHPFRLGFVGLHVLAALAYAVGWLLFVCMIDSIVTGHLTFVGSGIGLFLLTGVWLYIVVAGIAYANLAAQRTAMIEAQAARMQLDTLRTQLQPHFLFNALHTVVQLIPIDPRAAARAAEQLAGALRTTIEEKRDLIPLANEWAFVQRYLEIECIRFGDRLDVQVAIGEAARELFVPTFALQTLVENAVRHGAAPRVEPTRITIAATTTIDALTIVVSDNGNGASIDEIGKDGGTGLTRLRERMRWLYGDRARLEFQSEPASGFTATLVLPQLAESDHG